MIEVVAQSKRFGTSASLIRREKARAPPNQSRDLTIFGNPPSALRCVVTIDLTFQMEPLKS